MNNRFLLIMVACVAVFLGVLYFNRDGENSTSVEAEPSNHIYGVGTDASETDPENAVTLIEYGDFQCPACQSYYPLLKQLKENYKDQLTFQFRHYPLVAIHPNAMAAHKSAEAAGMQGKFWEMHDLIYEQQEAWKDSSNPAATFSGYAEQLDLDMEQYDADVASAEVNAIIQADIRSGKELNVQGTPAFVLEGELIESPASIEAFEQLIQDAIDKKTAD